MAYFLPNRELNFVDSKKDFRLYFATVLTESGVGGENPKRPATLRTVGPRFAPSYRGPERREIYPFSLWAEVCKNQPLAISP